MLLDRMPRGLAIALDNLGRGLIYAAVAILAALPVFPLAAVTVLVALGSALSPLSAAGIFSLVPDLLTDGQPLGSANAAINAVWQIATLVGPGLGGALVARFGAPLPIGLQATLYLAASALMAGLPRVRGGSAAGSSPLAGARLLFGTPALRAIALFTLAYWLLYAPLEVALPGFVSRDLRFGATAYGLLWTMNAIGALVGSVLSGLLPSLPRLGFRLAANYLLRGVITVALVFAGGFPAAALALGAAGLIYAQYPLWTNTYHARQESSVSTWP
jgi:MFS family permease